MRISSEGARKAGKVTGYTYVFGGWTFRAVLTIGLLVTGATVYEGTLVPQGEVSPIEQFLLENPAPKKQKKPQGKQVKQINLQVSKECKQYYKLVQKYFGPESTLRIAQMHKESSCDKDALGGVGEIGLFQVKQSTCDDMGVKGDLFDPETNIRCAAAYSRWLCKEKGHCEIVPNLVAYNAGGEGVKRVRNLSQHPYAHGIFKILGLRA
jgi:hypothetical protein